MTSSTREAELEDFKTRIDIRDVMASRDYVVDTKKSSRVYSVMRHASGDKLIVTRKANRHWIYANAHDNRDRGTVIDFLSLRDRTSLGEIRKGLRPWLTGGLTLTVPQRQFAELVPSEHDATRVLTAWETAQPIEGRHPYLEQDRGIPASVLADPIFAGRIRIDHRGNALFSHHNADGLCGFEIKNRKFTGFSPAGAKGLGCSRPRRNDQELVICETWIDFLSLAALEGTSGRRFMSVAGQISPAQEALLVSAARKMPPGSTVLLALDNDESGRKLAAQITQALEKSDGTLTVLTHLPDVEGHDWNDVLRSAQKSQPASPAPA